MRPFCYHNQYQTHHRIKYRPISFTNTDINSLQMLQMNIYKKLYVMANGIHPKNVRLHIWKSIIVTYNIKDQSPMNISIDAGRTFDKILQPFMIQTLSSLGIEGNFLNLLGSVCEKPTAHVED